MTVRENIKRFNTIFARSLQIDGGDIADAMSIDTVPSWDSFNSLLLISELEKGFKVRFPAEDVRSIKSVADLKASLRKHGVAV